LQGKTLLYIPSYEIVEFVANNPIDWEDKDRAKRGGVGDQAGVTPTPAVEEFLSLLLEKGSLFTQSEYMHYCWEKWRAWVTPKCNEQKKGIKAKLYRNFYPAMIDSLHVWSMLCESGMFNTCILNSTEDAIGKTDLIVQSGQRLYRIALLGPTINATSDRAYKIKHRGSDTDCECVEIQMPSHYAKTPGNKRWFKRTDIMNAILSANQESVAMVTQPN